MLVTSTAPGHISTMSFSSTWLLRACIHSASLYQWHEAQRNVCRFVNLCHSTNRPADFSATARPCHDKAGIIRWPRVQRGVRHIRICSVGMPCVSRGKEAHTIAGCLLRAVLCQKFCSRGFPMCIVRPDGLNLEPVVGPVELREGCWFPSACLKQRALHESANVVWQAASELLQRKLLHDACCMMHADS